MNRIPAALLLSAVAISLHPALAAGQALPLRRDVPEVRWSGCPAAAPVAPVDSARAARAEQLAAEATQAALLGDNDAAFALLEEAVALDPTSAGLAYRLARAAEESNRSARAVELYCRFLGLAPRSPDAADVRERLETLTAPAGFAVPATAAASFRRGIAAYDGQLYPDAEQAFGEAADAVPGWGAPVYNRGLARLAQGLGDVAAADLRRYLQLTPDAPEFDRILDLLGTPREPEAAPRNPLSTLAVGLAVPGLGHLTTGRTNRGLLILGGATAAVATGFLVEKVEVRCLGVPVDGRCPPDQVLGEDTSRPLLGPAVAVALVAGVVGAIDAYRGVVRENARAAGEAGANRERGRTGIRLAAPDVHVSLSGAHLDLLRIRF